jgi:branched-chain amino acid transport system substrate-binding protein
MTPDQERDFIERQVDAEISRRHFMQWSTKAGISGIAALSLSGGVLAACSSGGKKSTSPKVSTGSDNSGFGGGGTDTVKIGVIGVFSGVGAFVGRIVNNSLDAAVQQINSTGGIGGRKVEVIKRDAGTDPSAGVKAYQEFAGSKDVVGVLWCGASGLEESRAQIGQDNMPIICVFNDPYSIDKLYPASPERSMFQIVIPDKLAIDAQIGYAKEDRGYKNTAFLYDGLVFATSKSMYETAIKKHTDSGFTNAGTETYQLNDSDFGPQLQRLKAAGAQSIIIWGLTGDTSSIVKQIDRLGGAYVDTPTAKSTWKPQIMGSPGGTGEHTWADLAGPSAKAGSITTWYVGGVIDLPTFAIRDWMKKYLNKTPTGGEDTPADGLATILKGIEKAGSTDRDKVVKAIETMGKIKFASIDFDFTADRHINKTVDDLIFVDLERGSGPVKTDPAYELGREWKEVFAAGYVGPTHLVRPTLDANKRAQPSTMDLIMSQGWGTQCTKHPDGTLGKECKVH